MFQPDSCPKCGGWLLAGEDEFGKFWSCVNCGLLLDTKARGTPKKGHGSGHIYRPSRRNHTRSRLRG